MRWLKLSALLSACACTALQAGAETIESVLERSQQARLAQRPAADLYSAASQRLRASLLKLLALPEAAGPDVELRIVRGALHAEAALDRPAIVVSESIGDLPEGQRLLVLGHELGHLRLAHAQSLKALYFRHLPAEVARDATEAVAARLHDEGAVLQHRHEHEADAFGYRLVRQLGFGMQDVVGLLARQGASVDTRSHPGTASRFQRLRALDEELERAAASR